MAAILTSFIIGVIKVHYDRSKKPVQLIRFNLFPATPATRLTVLESGNNFANIKSFSRVTAGKFSYVIRNDTNLRVRNIFCSKEESRSLWNLSLFFFSLSVSPPFYKDFQSYATRFPNANSIYCKINRICFFSFEIWKFKYDLNFNRIKKEKKIKLKLLNSIEWKICDVFSLKIWI